MRVNRIVAIVSLLCLAIGSYVFAGGKQEAPTEEVKELEAKTLRWMCWTLAEEPSGSVEREMVVKFEKENPDIKIQLDPVPYPQMDVKFISQSRAKQAPDIYRAYEGSVVSFMEMGLLLDLEPYIMKSGGKSFKDQFVAALEPLSSYKSNWYGLVSWVVPQNLVYNKDMFTQVGLDPNIPPKNWKEFISYAKKLTRINEAGEQQWGFVIRGEKTHSTTLRLISFFYTNGAKILTDDNSQAIFDGPKGIEAFKFIVELFTKHQVIPPGIPEANGGFLNNMIAQEKAAMIEHGYNNIAIWGNMVPGLDKKLALEHMPYEEVETTTGLAAVMVISNQCKYPEAAWKFITYIVNKENQAKMFTEANFLPTRDDVLMMPEVQNRKDAKAAIESVENLTIYPHIPEWPEISFAIIEAFHDAVAGNKTPEQALKDAAAKSNQVLRK